MVKALLEMNLQAGVLIAFLFVLISVFGKRMSVKTRFCLWFLPVARLLCPILPQSPVGLFSSHETGLANQVFTAVQTTPGIRIQHAAAPSLPEQAGASGYDVFAVIWLCGAAVLLAAMLCSNLMFYRKIKYSVQRGGVFYSDAVSAPMVFGLVKPKILLPMHKKLSDRQRQMVIAHERAHIKRGDLILFSCLDLICIVFWFNPFVWLMARQMKYEAELLCDGAVLKGLNCEDALLYGETILQLARSFQKPARLCAAAGILGGKQHLKTRIRMIANYSKKAYRVSAVGILLLLLVGCVSLTNNTIKNPSPKPEQTQPARQLEYTYVIDQNQLEETLLCAEQKGTLDLLKVLRQLEVSYEGNTNEDGSSTLTVAYGGEEAVVTFGLSGADSIDYQGQRFDVPVGLWLRDGTVVVSEKELVKLLRQYPCQGVQIDPNRKQITLSSQELKTMLGGVLGLQEGL